MKNQTNVERFYEWLQRCGNVYLNDHSRVVRAFHIVALNDIEVIGCEIVKPN